MLPQSTTLWFAKGVTMRRYLTFGVLAVLLTSGAVLAQSPPTGDEPATREDVTQLFAVMKSHDQIHSIMDAMLKQQRIIMHDIIKKQYPDTSEDEFRRLDSFMDDFLKTFPLDAMIDDMIPVYQKHLSKTDVEAMTAFYSAPTGQKLLREMPAIVTDSMQAMAPRLQQMMEKMRLRVEQLAKDEHEKKAGSAPKPSS
jgi:uncharacterized protein